MKEIPFPNTLNVAKKIIFDSFLFLADLHWNIRVMGAKKLSMSLCNEKQAVSLPNMNISEFGTVTETWLPISQAHYGDSLSVFQHLFLWKFHTN